ncbi:restriction endonuclease subunit S [Staphylococcus sp. GDY8P168P-1]|nr:restriction endonuclease subunit S [Staphylococcus sp. GDY8P168P-1]
MTNQEKKVPELRFPEFDGEWDITTIEKIAKVSKGFTPSTKDINLWQNDNKNWLSIAGMSDKYIYEGNKGISSAGEGKHKKVNKDTLIMSFKLTLGKLAIVKTPIYTNEAICHFEWKTNQLKTEYMYYYLSFINIKSFGAQAVKGITLNNDSINSILIKLPGFLEQEKIGTFFSKLDQQIELEEKKLAKLEEQKKGYMQKIFSQELRFKDEKGNDYPEWEVKQLKEILEFSNKRTTKENEYPILTSSRKGLILQSDYYKEGKTFADSNVGYFILPKNFITYRSRSDDGIFKFNLNQIIDTGIISKYYPVFKGINSNQYYLALHLNNQLKKEYIKYATGTSQLVLSHKNLQEIKTKLPFYDEQTKIADFLIKFDELIEKQNQKIDGLKSRKKGFLQKMFV